MPALSHRLRRAKRLLALCAGLWTLSGGAAGDPDARIQQNNEQLQRVRGRIAELTRDIEQDRSRQDRLQAQLEQAEQAIAEARAALDEVGARVNHQTDKVHQIQMQRDSAQRKLDSERASLAAQVRDAYVVGSGSPVELALGQADPGRVARMMGYYEYLDQARAQHIGMIDQELQHVASLEQNVTDEQKSLQKLQEQRRDAFSQLQQRRTERGAALSHSSSA